MIDPALFRIRIELHHGKPQKRSNRLRSKSCFIPFKREFLPGQVMYAGNVWVGLDLLCLILYIQPRNISYKLVSDLSILIE